MKAWKTTLCGLLLASAIAFGHTPQSTAQHFVAAMPDLKLMDIDEYGGYAWVLIKNVGTGASGACELRAKNISNGVWSDAGTAAVGALQPGASVWKKINGIGGQVRYYKVDYWNAVGESSEANNAWYIPYGPAG